MTIIISQGHKETGEVEFSGKHPDVFSTHVAADLVRRLAKETDVVGNIEEFRADLNVQSFALPYRGNGATPVRVGIAGQLVVPDVLDLSGITREGVDSLLERAGYFRYRDFSSEKVEIDLRGIIAQSPVLNHTSKNNKFADSCVVYGHYIAPPFGLNGTFPSLIVGQRISRTLENFGEEIDFLRSDGKVHVTVKYTDDGFIVDDVYLSVAHARDVGGDFRDMVYEGIVERVEGLGLEEANWNINAGGDFQRYFLQADSGISKAKDDVVVTGGVHQLGTDRIWGKCLFKASSVLIPYTFALSKVVSEVTGARFASVSAFSRYGGGEADLRLQDIDSTYEGDRESINTILQGLPRDVQGIREVLGMSVNVESYRFFNDVEGFHGNDNPWKKNNPGLEGMFRESYAGGLAVVRRVRI
jgi:hypothetical protein